MGLAARSEETMLFTELTLVAVRGRSRESGTRRRNHLRHLYGSTGC